MKSLAERFWSKVYKTEGCWFWLGGVSNEGYGRIGKGRAQEGNVPAHHASWFLHFGYWPKYLMHSCDTGQCVRPDHLKEATHAENKQDAANKGMGNTFSGELHRGGRVAGVNF